MHLRTPAIVGIGIGLAAALLVLSYGSLRHHEPGPVMLPDHGGPVRAVVLQYARGSQFVAPVFRAYLGWQKEDVTAYIACPQEEDWIELRGLLGEMPCTLVPVYTHHAMTAWSRDRWVALTTAQGASSGPVMLLAPKGEQAAEIWPAREGDARVALDLSAALPAVFSARRSELYFDGGDFLAEGPHVFATRALIERNVQHTVTTIENLKRAIARDLGLAPILLPEGPPHHAGMFMMSAGPSDDGTPTMLVADPSLGRQHYDRKSNESFQGGPDFSIETQRQFDSVARVCREAGYRVVRIAVVPAREGPMYMTYVNVILDRVAGRPVVYMSTYDGQEAMNAAAAEVWSTLGYEVRPINCTSVWRHGGTLHCLVNVFARGT